MARNEAVDSEVSMTSVFGRSETQVATPEFRGGRLRVIFGSGDLELNEAGLADSGAMVNVIAIFGGVSIRVPHQWDVNIRTRAIFGGVESKRTPPASAEGQLTITGWRLFGGVTIRS